MYTKILAPSLQSMTVLWIHYSIFFSTGNFGWYTIPYSFRFNQRLCVLFQFLLSFLAPSSLSFSWYRELLLTFLPLSFLYPTLCNVTLWASDDVFIDSLYVHHFVVLLYISLSFCKLFCFVNCISLQIKFFHVASLSVLIFELTRIKHCTHMFLISIWYFSCNLIQRFTVWFSISL